MSGNEDFAAVGDLITSTASFHPKTLVGDVAESFIKSSDLDAAALVEEGRPVGLLTRVKFLSAVFRRYGWELYGRKSVASVAVPEPLCVPCDERLDSALARAVARPPEDAYDDLIVVDDGGQFRGLLSVRQMIIRHSHSLANILMQKDLATERALEFERLSELKSQFLASVTHELRSPVNAIIELTELVRMSAAKGYVQQVNDRLSLLLASATSLRSIVTNILDLSKIEAGKMQLIVEDFDLLEVLEEVVGTTRVLANGKSVEVLLDAPPQKIPFRSDPVKCRQIALNLMSNAAKFTNEGQIRLTCRVDDMSARIAVDDTGVGIRSEDQARLFLPFSQLEDSKVRSHEGTGLGLAITRELTELLGGTVSLASEFGKGSTFTVVIPRRTEEDE